MTAQLGWGRRFLMCPPEHFGVLYEINPWMHREVTVDLDRARAQWDGLVAALEGAGAQVERLEARPGLPDLVFTANAGMVNGGRFVPSRFRHPQRAPEVPHYVDWFAAHGYSVEELPAGVAHEGAGDALPFGGVFLSGYRYRSDAAAHAALSRLLGAAVRPVELADPRFYHLDLTFCPLDDRRALVAPHCWDSYARRVVEALVPEPIVLDDDEVVAFCANSVVVGTAVVMPACPPSLGRRLEAAGFDVAVAPVGEFAKAGGACRCLTLALDVALPPTGPTGRGARDVLPPSTAGGAAR
ncbi:MAG: amidinotransferase [Actinomycetota bacterium]|nr:amidinotransferase [Actinomycetota bacterium]